LTSVNILSALIIGERAFYYCLSLAEIALPDNLQMIGGFAFFNCTNLTTIYYGGADSAEWAMVVIGASNAPLQSAAVYYYSKTQPGTAGNYWHYGADGTPTVWE
jgi:hypothetical protein